LPGPKQSLPTRTKVKCIFVHPVINLQKGLCKIVTTVHTLKLRLKNTIIDKTLIYALETWKLTKRDRKQMNIFERKVYRRILGPVYDNENEN
jgi:hypothetical protein